MKGYNMKPVKCICGREPLYDYSFAYLKYSYWCNNPKSCAGNLGSNVYTSLGNTKEEAIQNWNKRIANRWENAEKKNSGEVKCDCRDSHCKKAIWSVKHYFDSKESYGIEFWVRTKSGNEDLFYLSKETTTKLISQLQFRLKQLEKEQVKKPDWRWINQRLPYCPECINQLESEMVGDGNDQDTIKYTCVNKDCDYVYKL